MTSRTATTVALFGLLTVGAAAAFRPIIHPAVVQADSPLPTERPSLPLGPPAQRDLDQIRERKTLVVLAPYNSTTYFLYRGEPMGYEYELLKEFAKDRKLALRVVVVRNTEQLAPMLRKGEGDVIAARLIPAEEPEASRNGLAFTGALYKTKPALVQEETGGGKPKQSEQVQEVIDEKAIENPQPGHGLPTPQSGAGAEDPAGHRISARLITRPSQLAGEEVTLPRGSAYLRTLAEIEDEITGDIRVVQVGSEIDSETLIERVAKGEVGLTVAQENLAELKETVYANLAVTPTLGPKHSISWAVRNNSPELLGALNRWIEEEKDGPLFRSLYQKYFVDRRRYRERVESEYLTSKTGRLSRFDSLLKEYSPALDWDWRMLASLAYQESRFNPTARSWAGAAGLLQLMPATARGFGCRNRSDPEENVRGGTRFLAWLKEFWEKKIENPDERLKFVLASYNAGPGHVQDGRRLAEKHGDNPDVWDDVAYWMLHLSDRKYYTDPVVRHGFCRGMEPVTYVGLILERFDHYRQFVDR